MNKPLQILAEKYVQMQESSESTKRTDEYGNESWYNSKGEFHRTDGPAVEWLDGGNEWWINGKRHRLDGPAIECADGDLCWFIDDKMYTKKQFKEYLKALKARQDILNKDNPGIEMDI